MNAHRVRLEPAALSVEAGAETTCEVRIWNVGDVVDAFDVQVLGPAAAWTTVEPATVPLFPGASGVARLTFRPPRDASVPAGPMPFGARVVSQAAGPATAVVEEGSLDVGPFTEVSAELLPRTSHGRFSGHHRIHLSNRGNTPAAVRLAGSDAEQALTFSLGRGIVAVGPGRAAFANIRARVAHLSWTGAAKRWTFDLTAATEGKPPVQMQGVMEQRPVFGKWTLRGIALIALAAIGLTIAHFQGAQIRAIAANLISGNRTQVANGSQVPAGSTTPTVAATVPPTTSPSAATSAAPSAPPSAAFGANRPVVAAATCASNPVSIASLTTPQAIPGLAVTFDGGTVGRSALVDLSGNLNVGSGAEVHVSYSVDGGPAQENVFGPANLADPQALAEARAVTAVMGLGPGTHTVTPYWRVTGASGRTATIDKRCFAVRAVDVGAPSSSPVATATNCAGDPISTASPSAAQPIPGLAVTVNNGPTARQAIVQVSANLAIDVDAEVRLAYSVDGNAVQENAYGPANFANPQQGAEGRDVTALIPLGAGSHTVAAYWRVSGSSGKTAHMDTRCITVESVAGAAPDSTPDVAAATCAGGGISTTSPAVAGAIPNLSVTLNNGAVARTAVVTVSANVGVDPNAQVLVAFSVDGGPAQENQYGPADLAAHQEYYEARDAVAVIPLAPGAHTVSAWWRISGPAGTSAQMDARCLTVESVSA
jgi:hypothetical protein